MLKRGEKMCKVDLKNVYTVLMMHPQFQKYLTFRWNGSLYRYKTLPFGLNIAPQIFTQLIRHALALLWKKGICLIAYLDDILIMGKTDKEVVAHTQELILHLTELGFMINMKKSRSLSHIQEFLGHMIDSKRMTMSLSNEKLKQIKYEARRLIRVGKISVQKLASFLGLLNSMCQMVFTARLHARWLQFNLKHALQWTGWEGEVQLLEQALKSLAWWYEDLEQWNGQSIIPVEADIVFGGTTNAIKMGYGIATQVERQGLWMQEESQESINYLELKAILLAVQLISADQDGQHISDGICQQDGWDVKPQIDAPGRTDLGDLPQTHDPSPGPACGRSRQYAS